MYTFRATSLFEDQPYLMALAASVLMLGLSGARKPRRWKRRGSQRRWPLKALVEHEIRGRGIARILRNRMAFLYGFRLLSEGEEWNQIYYSLTVTDPPFARRLSLTPTSAPREA